MKNGRDEGKTKIERDVKEGDKSQLEEKKKDHSLP
jgi:hypothetical protein